MPIYCYRCQKCEYDIEVMQKVGEPPLSTCEKCGGDLRKVIAPCGVIFKGSGFHLNDYRSGKSVKGDATADDKTGETKGETKSEMKGETKSETSSDAGTKTTEAPSSSTQSSPADKKVA